MNNYQTLQNWCQIGIAVFGFLSLLCTYGTYYFGNLKEKTIKNQAMSNTINAPNSLITTQNQSGGTNTINYSGGKFNPANISQTPVFDETGYFGLNLLNDNVVEISQNIAYSFAVKIPVNSKMKVVLNKIGDDKKPLWGMDISKEKYWISDTYDEGQQVYTLYEEFGDLEIKFNESGSAKMQIFFNDKLLKEKVISWK